MIPSSYRIENNKGLNRGDRIGMYGVNHYEWIVTQLAAAKAGLVLGKDTHCLFVCLHS